MNAVLGLTEEDPRRLSKTKEQIEAFKTNLLKSSACALKANNPHT